MAPRIEGLVAKVGLHLTDEWCSSLSRQFSWTSIGDEAAVLSEVVWSVPRKCLVDKGSDLERGVLPLEVTAACVKLVRCSCIAECPSPTAQQCSGSTEGDTFFITVVTILPTLPCNRGMTFFAIRKDPALSLPADIRLCQFFTILKMSPGNSSLSTPVSLVCAPPSAPLHISHYMAAY